MNTRISVVVPGIPADTEEALAIAIEQGLRRDDALMSRFDPHAELARVNRAAGTGPIPLSERLFAILTMCRSHWERTGGAFDVTLGAINDNWRGEGGAARVGGWENVALDAKRGTVAFFHPALRLDLGGVGKGIALKGLGETLRRYDVAHAFVSFGDSSLLTMGGQPGGEHWSIGVRDRLDPSAVLHTFALVDGSVSTSGVDRSRTHLVNPAKRDATIGDRTLAVSCPCPIDAEVLSTALIVRPRKDRIAILASYGRAQAVEFEWPAATNAAARRLWSYAAG